MTAAALSRLDRSDAEALATARHGDPFKVLGPRDGPAGRTVVVFLPGAQSVEVLRRGDRAPLGRLIEGEMQGLFEGPVSDASPYLLRIKWPEAEQETEDPYAFGPLLGELDLHLFNEGRHFKLAESLGANVVTAEGVQGVRFAVWAPNAERVAVIGDFNSWDARRHPMRLRVPSGIWELFVPRLGAGARYKFDIVGAGGMRLPGKADPVAQQAEPAPATASVVAQPPSWRWTDERWMANRAERQSTTAPISIYEVHIGSWLRPGADEHGSIVGPRHRAPHPLSGRSRLHPSRAAADHRASVRRLVGLSAARTVRAQRQLRPARSRSPVSSTPCTRPTSVFCSTGCRRIFRPTRTAWRASTARRSTSTSIRAKASTATGTPTSTISAGARFRAS